MVMFHSLSEFITPNNYENENMNMNNNKEDEDNLHNVHFLQYYTYEEAHKDIQLYSTLTNTQWIDRTEMTREYTTDQGLN